MTDKKPCPVCTVCCFSNDCEIRRILYIKCQMAITCPNRLPDPAVAKLEKIRAIVDREDGVYGRHYYARDLAKELDMVLDKE